jgi:hypothetical protein
MTKPKILIVEDTMSDGAANNRGAPVTFLCGTINSSAKADWRSGIIFVPLLDLNVGERGETG